MKFLSRERFSFIDVFTVTLAGYLITDASYTMAIIAITSGFALDMCLKELSK